MRVEQKKVIQKEMDRLEHLGIIRKGLTGYSSPVVLVKRKNQNLYRVCSDFWILNEKLLKINHTFPPVQGCIEQLGRSKCNYMSTIDLRGFSYFKIGEDISKVLWSNTILWITHLPLLMFGYGYEHQSTDLATICHFSISR